jgi:predicted nuclease of predicted toxin-antitoxin system
VSGLKARVDRLYSSIISDVSSRIIVTKDDKVMKKVTHGTNPQKIIQIEVRL